MFPNARQFMLVKKPTPDRADPDRLSYSPTNPLCQIPTAKLDKSTQVLTKTTIAALIFG